jgi:hypothetical protein
MYKEPGDDLKQEEVELNASSSVEDKAELPAAVAASNTASGEHVSAEIKKVDDKNTDGKRENEKLRTKRQFNLIVKVGSVLVVLCVCFAMTATFLFGLRTATQLVPVFFESPAVNNMENLSGYGWNFFQGGQDQIRFKTSRPVTLIDAEKYRKFGLKDRKFMEAYHSVVDLFPVDRTNMEDHLGQIEVLFWYDRGRTLVHDKTTDLYLFCCEHG